MQESIYYRFTLMITFEMYLNTVGHLGIFLYAVCHFVFIEIKNVQYITFTNVTNILKCCKFCVK